jgi:cell division protein FtsZ
VAPAAKDTMEEQKPIQADLLFDLPLNSKNKSASAEKLKEEASVNVNDISVFNAEEVVCEPKAHQTRYVLEDFDAKPTIGKSSHIIDKKAIVHEEEEMVFELKTTDKQLDINRIETTSEEVSPLDLTIAELQKRAQERREKMKGFNYKFNDQLSKNIDEIERQPAYKRQGLDLGISGPLSTTKTAIQKGEELDFKSNNSFLHDNVD